MANKQQKEQQELDLPDDEVDIELVDKEVVGEKKVVIPDEDDGKIVIESDSSVKAKTDLEKAKDDEDDESESEFRKANPDDIDESDIDREARRLANRARRDANKDKRRRAAEYKDSKISELQRKVDELSGQVATTSRTSQLDIDAMAIQSAVNERLAKVQEAERLFVAADAEMDSTKKLSALNELYTAKQQYDQAAIALSNVNKLRKQAEQTTPINPEKSDAVQQKAKKFFAEHSWYDASGGDRDSRRALFISQELIREGFDPNFNEYWSELRDRVAEELPHRRRTASRQQVEDDDDIDDDEPPRKAALPQKKLPVSSGGGERESRGERKNVLDELTPLQRTMLNQSGIEKGTEPWKKIVAEYAAKNRANRER